MQGNEATLGLRPLPAATPGLKGRVTAARISLVSFAWQMRTTLPIHIQLVVDAVVVALGVWRRFSVDHWAIVVLLVGFGWYSEMNNSTHEETADGLVEARYGRDYGDCRYHCRRAKAIKDRASGTVTIVLMMVLVIIPMFCIWPH